MYIPPLKPNCFRAICDLEVEPGVNKTTRLISVKVTLDVGKLFDENMYYDNENLPNTNGIKVMTSGFIQGLLSNMKIAHQQGFWNEAEHMKFIIDELNRGFTDIDDFKISKSPL